VGTVLMENVYLYYEKSYNKIHDIHYQLIPNN
jgi:hypothetical protein